jgi:hypothetical protein
MWMCNLAGLERLDSKELRAVTVGPSKVDNTVGALADTTRYFKVLQTQDTAVR